MLVMAVPPYQCSAAAASEQQQAAPVASAALGSVCADHSEVGVEEEVSTPKPPSPMVDKDAWYSPDKLLKKEKLGGSGREGDLVH